MGLEIKLNKPGGVIMFHGFRSLKASLTLPNIPYIDNHETVDSGDL